ncbi:UNVERIFIED_CONTAM: hypothetical protein FKN15_015670 [Acipenser sinensis]
MGKKSRQRQQKLQQQQQEEVGDDRWEAVARRLAAELCPGCGEYGHTVAICPSQYREEPERPVREDLHPPKRTNALSSEGVWDWLVEPGRDYEEALPAVINLLWARDGERWETWEQQHHPASLPDIAAMVLNYLAADMRGVPPSPGKKGEAPLPSLAPEGEEPPLPSPATKGEEPERPTPEWEEPERPTPEWEEPERPTPEWEEPERPTPEWEEPERPTPEWEEPERPTPEWEEPERPTPEWEEPERPTPEWEEPERPTPEWEEPERPTPEWEEPERPQPKEGGCLNPQVLSLSLTNPLPSYHSEK